jgi:hypothetical protein
VQWIDKLIEQLQTAVGATVSRQALTRIDERLV